jgi:hypothetical protein
VSEQEDAVETLGANGVLAALAWACDSARHQTLQSYDPETGHDQAWIGTNMFTVLQDRLNRVCSLGRFVLRSDADPTDGADLLAGGLAPGEFERMPHLSPGLVIRDDLNGSPGWLNQGWRILLQSYGGMDIDEIKWARRSRTKRRVASQPCPDAPMLDLPEFKMAADVLADLSKREQSDNPIVTLVLAYAIDAVTGLSAFYLGHPRLNFGGGDPWYWRVSIEDCGQGGTGRGLRPGSPTDQSSSPVEDAAVRLRSHVAELPDAQASA